MTRKMQAAQVEQFGQPLVLKERLYCVEGEAFIR